MDPDAVPLREAARPLHGNDIRVFAIGVGHHYNRSQLRDIVERDQDLFEADDFDALLNLVKKIARGTCAPAPGTNIVICYNGNTATVRSSTSIISIIISIISCSS